MSEYNSLINEERPKFRKILVEANKEMFKQWKQILLILVIIMLPMMLTWSLMMQSPLSFILGLAGLSIGMPIIGIITSVLIFLIIRTMFFNGVDNNHNTILKMNDIGIVTLKYIVTIAVVGVVFATITNILEFILISMNVWFIFEIIYLLFSVIVIFAAAIISFVFVTEFVFYNNSFRKSIDNTKVVLKRGIPKINPFMLKLFGFHLLLLPVAIICFSVMSFILLSIVQPLQGNISEVFGAIINLVFIILTIMSFLGSLFYILNIQMIYIAYANVRQNLGVGQKVDINENINIELIENSKDNTKDSTVE